LIRDGQLRPAARAFIATFSYDPDDYD